MMEANRYAWNLLVEKLENKLFTLNKKELETSVRHYVQKRNIDPSLSIASCPEECFDSAYRDILKAKKAIIAASVAKKKKEGMGFRFPERLNYKTKKHGSTSIEIRGRSLKYNPSGRTISLFKKYFNDNHNIKMKTNLKKLGIINFNYSCRLTKSNGKFFLMVPYIRQVNPIDEKRVCGIDPGVRTFLSGYDPTGSTFEISADNIYLNKKKKTIRELQTKLSKTENKKKRSRIIKKIRNIHSKISNYINCLHHKVSKLLSESYSEILLPTFGTQNMVKKKNRKINATTANNMMILSHYKFQQLLKHKMDIRSGKLHLCTEEYTSKTCSVCGRLNHHLGASKVFKCPYEDCGAVLDRDTNGAHNIFVKNYSILGYHSGS